MRKRMELRNAVKDKKFWFASFIIVWAAGLQGHMMWLQRQDSFKHKFGTLDHDAVVDDDQHQHQQQHQDQLHTDHPQH